MEEATRLLIVRLAAHYREIADKALGRGNRAESASFGHQVRSYVLDKQRRVVDHRTGFECDPGSILNGRIDGLLRRSLERRIHLN
jgi:protein subunit release factor B